MQLARVVVRIETVLRSDEEVPKGEVPIYYFLWGMKGGYSGPPRLGKWSVGDRVMFFLQRENGHLRTICDQNRGCAIQVFSGAHPRFRTANPAYSVIDLLLTRGQGAGDEQMIRAIDTSRAFDIDLDYAVQKLPKLIAEETPAVATAACRRLKGLLDQCAPQSCNTGPFAVVCNDRSNMHLPCPGPCCGYGDKAINVPKAHR